MRTRPVAVATTAIVLALALIGYRHAPVEGQTTPASGAAVSSEKGGQDVFGAYDVAPWPKPLTMLPGHEAWTWGAGQYVFAESPNRVFVLQRGELPVVARPKQPVRLPQIGPSIEFPMFRLPVTISTPGSQVSTTAGSTSSPSGTRKGI